jgi:carbon storage regulator
MLILSRKERETIRIGPDVVVTVTRISGEQVRIGVVAPPNVVILRGELAQQSPQQSPPSPPAAEGGASDQAA